MKRSIAAIALIVLLLATAAPVGAAPSGTVGINVLLNTPITDAIVADLNQHGTVLDVLPEINALTMRIAKGTLSTIRGLPYVAAAETDKQVSYGPPVDTVQLSNFSGGLSTWDLDTTNVTDYGQGRTIGYDGTGVYVAVIDTGLVSIWRQYLPNERIAEQYGIAFGGGGGDKGTVSTQPDKWENDTNSHGTHVASTILGYSLNGVPINGMAPMANVIPVKVLNQNGSGWDSVVAEGILYVAGLKAGALSGHPVVINMSLGGSRSALDEAAIDYAIKKGVLIVASAGNAGDAGMGYPGAYKPVISVAALGWTGQWKSGSWWLGNVPDPTDAANFFIADFSSRQLAGQDLDVAAPGDWVVGPYNTNQGQASYYYLSGTSMASPHVAGIVALMAQKDPGLTQAQAEKILEETAVPLPAGSRTVLNPDGTTSTVSWGDNASGAGIATANAALKKTP